jgi:hypothetical protein
MDPRSPARVFVEMTQGLMSRMFSSHASSFQGWLETIFDRSSPFHDRDEASIYIEHVENAHRRVDLNQEVHTAILTVITASLSYLGLALKSTHEENGCVILRAAAHGGALRMPEQCFGRKRDKISLLCASYIETCCKMLGALGYSTLVKSIYNRVYCRLVESSGDIATVGLDAFQARIALILSDMPLTRALAGRVSFASDEALEEMVLVVNHGTKSHVIRQCECGLLPKFVNNGIDMGFACVSRRPCGYRLVV